MGGALFMRDKAIILGRDGDLQKGMFQPDFYLCLTLRSEIFKLERIL